MSRQRTSSYSQLVAPLAKAFPGKYCNWCNRKLPANKKSFCSKHCVEEWSIRTSSSFARLKVKQRDKGVCAACGINTEQLKKRIYAKHPKSKLKRNKLLKRLGYHPNRAMWEMDHINEVCKGGGLSPLKNLQTLCYPCHQLKTKKLMKEINNA